MRGDSTGDDGAITYADAYLVSAGTGDSYYTKSDDVNGRPSYQEENSGYRLQWDSDELRWLLLYPDNSVAYYNYTNGAPTNGTWVAILSEDEPIPTITKD